MKTTNRAYVNIRNLYAKVHIPFGQVPSPVYVRVGRHLDRQGLERITWNGCDLQKWWWR